MIETASVADGLEVFLDHADGVFVDLGVVREAVSHAGWQRDGLDGRTWDHGFTVPGGRGSVKHLA